MPNPDGYYNTTLDTDIITDKLFELFVAGLDFEPSLK